MDKDRAVPSKDDLPKSLDEIAGIKAALEAQRLKEARLITELEALRKSEERLELAIEGADLGWWDHDMTSNKVERGGRWASMLGYKPAEIESGAETWKNLIHPEDLDAVNDTCEEHESGQTPNFRVEHRLQSKTGDWRWILNWGRVIERDEAGGPVRATGIHLDITERKRVELALADSEQRFRELADLLPQTIIELNSKLEVSYLNRHGFESSGYDQSDIGSGLHATRLVIPEQQEKVTEYFLAAMNGDRPESYEYTAQRKDGSEYNGLICSRAIIRDNEPVGLRAILVDITDRKRLESEMAKMDKLDSIGTLAGGIAHDFNNLLTAILGYVSLARMERGIGRKVANMLAEIDKAAVRARDLTQQLLTFSKGGAPILKTTSVEKLLRDSAALALHGSNVKCEFDIPRELHAVDVGEGQICQVFNNVLINADQATPDGGVVEIRCQNITVEKSADLPLSKGEYVEIAVEDQGTGIPKQHLKKIFDPFFTTKHNGSGLGLATAYSILRNHKGLITAESKMAQGTTFYVYIPASKNKCERETEVSERLIKGKGRILVVDDELGVREFVGQGLKKLGYEPVLAAYGQEALGIYKRGVDSSHPVNAIILDLTIPGGMGGKETVAALRRIDPEVKAIVSSGYSNDPVLANFEEYGFSGRLAKPYRISELGNVLNRVLAKDT